ncbi:MAG: sigma-70 family RNA polymerase sigma factor [Phycisphaerae bacterium]|nr:sigma-70 family RNA polymerase sigma factor [Phycisphaerae bacterium]
MLSASENSGSFGASRTDWGLVCRAGDPTAALHSESLEAVARRYWPIIHAYIRHTGRNEEDARDLTQSFLADVLLGRGLLAIASPARGRFRALLLHAVSNYLRDDHRRRSAGHRPPAASRVPLSGTALVVTDSAASPERAFASAWVAMLVADAAERLRDECRRDGRDERWTCFEYRVLRPALHGSAPSTTEELRTLTGLTTGPRVVHALAQAKRRFAQLLLEIVGRSADDPLRVREEVGELLSILGGRT